eukprot:615511-Amphidinium_carterae.1
MFHGSHVEEVKVVVMHLYSRGDEEHMAIECLGVVLSSPSTVFIARKPCYKSFVLFVNDLS